MRDTRNRLRGIFKMALSEQTAREVAQVIRNYVDPATIKKIIEDLQEVRSDKNFRDVVELFARLAQ